MKLPKLTLGVDGDYSVAPVTWTSDGKIVVLINNKQISIYRVTK